MFRITDTHLHVHKRVRPLAGTADVGVLEAGGFANITEQESFCEAGDCVIGKIYDQSPEGNHLGQRISCVPRQGCVYHKMVNASKHKIEVAGGKFVYGMWLDPGCVGSYAQPQVNHMRTLRLVGHHHRLHAATWPGVSIHSHSFDVATGENGVQFCVWLDPACVESSGHLKSSHSLYTLFSLSFIFFTLAFTLFTPLSHSLHTLFHSLHTLLSLSSHPCLTLFTFSSHSLLTLFGVTNRYGYDVDITTGVAKGNEPESIYAVMSGTRLHHCL
jgi:hypothetical protein